TSSTTSASSSTGSTGASCTNGLQDGTESDVDCGGPACPACPAGQRCGTALDCQNGLFCASGVCSTASCPDGVKDGPETDVDCGGQDGCARCTAGKKCVLSSDCLTGLSCIGGSCQCNGTITSLGASGPATWTAAAGSLAHPAL